MFELDICEIDDLDGKKIAQGSIMEYDSGIMRISVENSSSFTSGMTARIYIFNNFLGECVFDGIVSAAAQRMVCFSQIQMVQSRQRRENTRVSKRIDYIIRYKIQNKDKVKLENPIKITMLNISANGMYFSSSEQLPIDFVFPLEFKETDKPVHLVVRILRREQGELVYRYGCKFEISEREMDTIYRFVLQEQIRQKRQQSDY